MDEIERLDVWEQEERERIYLPASLAGVAWGLAGGPSGARSWERKFRKRRSVGTRDMSRGEKKVTAGVWRREMSGEGLLSLTLPLGFSTGVSTGNICWY